MASPWAWLIPAAIAAVLVAVVVLSLFAALNWFSSKSDLEKSLELAVREAKRLKKYVELKFTIILLEPKEQLYTDAAKTISKAAGGSVIVTDPQELATEMLMDYIEVWVLIS